MIKTLSIRHYASLVLLACFAVASIGADNCLGFGDAPPLSAPPSANPTCPSGQQRYACVVIAYGLPLTLCEIGPYDAGCSANLAATPCAFSEQDAQNRAANLAKAVPVKGKILTPTCAVLHVDSSTPIYNDLVPDGACTCTGGGTGGSSTGGPACLSNGDVCGSDTDCCSSICSEGGACEACRADLEGCIHNADCCSGVCSLNACGGNVLHLHDGGLGFGDTGTGGGSP
jgi:hypothetical protein